MKRPKEILLGGNEKIEAARYLRLLVRIAAAVLAVVFAWLKLKGVDFTPIAKNISTSIVFNSAMAIYFGCWVAGLIADTDAQELVYVAPPDSRHIKWGGASVAFFITVTFGILCFVDTLRAFAVFLAVFLLINVLSWRYLTKRALPRIVAQSEDFYQKNRMYAKYEQLRLVYHCYLSGRWQWARFGVAGGIIILMCWLSYQDKSNIQIAGHLLESDLIFSLSLLLYVSIIEVWMWFMRFRMRVGLQLLGDLQGVYKFGPASASRAKAARGR